MPLYLGIDAGGTKTDCAVSNGAELLGQATGASCKLARVGKERGRENLASGDSPGHRSRARGCQQNPACVHRDGRSFSGGSGALGATDHPRTDAGFHDLCCGRPCDRPSRRVWHVAGRAGDFRHGIDCFWTQPERRNRARRGWGPNVSDEGSAFWVGREAVTAALHAFDFGKSNGLLATIADCWKVAPEEVIRLANCLRTEIPRIGWTSGERSGARRRQRARHH